MKQVVSQLTVAIVWGPHMAPRLSSVIMFQDELRDISVGGRRGAGLVADAWIGTGVDRRG